MDYEALRCPLQQPIAINDVFTAFSAQREAGFRFEGEAHDFWELVYVVRGSIWAAEEQHILQLHENMFILHKPLAFHRLWCDKEGASIKILSFTAGGEATARLDRRSGVLPWHLRDLLIRTVDRAGALLDGEQGERAAVAAGIACLLENIAQTAVSPLPDQGRDDFERLMAVIHTHYRENLSLGDIAAQCHMSESKVKKVFRRVYDLGIMKYICKLRMREAGEMLADGTGIDEICEILHFTDRNYFSYAFKRETGISPREYRRKYAKTDKNS